MQSKTSQEIHTIKAGKRIYFIDLKNNENGDQYLKLTESKLIKEGEFERHSILIEKEFIQELSVKLLDTLHHFENGKPIEEVISKSHMEQLKEKYANAYKPWEPDEDERLSELFKAEKSIRELSEIFQRNEGAIESRLKKLKE